MTTERRIYVACLSSYNAGSLVGAWIDMAEVLDTSDLLARCQAAIKGEEWAIHDHEGWYGLLKGEHHDMAEVFDTHTVLAGLEEWHDSEAITAAIAIAGDDFATALENLHGQYDNQGDYAESVFEDCGALKSVPEQFRMYIDFEAMERDMELNGDISAHTVNGTRYIFGQW